MVADFELGLGQARKAAAVEQFGLEAVPKGFGAGVVAAFAEPARALLRAVPGEQVLELRGRLLAVLVGTDHQGREPAHG